MELLDVSEKAKEIKERDAELFEPPTTFEEAVDRMFLLY